MMSIPARAYLDLLIPSSSRDFETGWTLADIAYANELSRMAKEKSPDKFNNSKPLHAAVVMENIYRSTRERANGRPATIRLYASTLNGEISRFGNYRSELLAFLQADNTHIKVIIDTEPERPGSFDNAFEIISTYAEHFPEKAQIKAVQATDNLRQFLYDQLQQKDVHFAVSSEQMYRLELDAALHFAECCFFQPEKSKELIAVFDKMFDPANGMVKPLQPF